uniref:SOCS box domain-containing protein n=1 Tax=Esox lucius TaxID=8010 RepID=A0AAY5KVJ2_ESOLU
MADVEVDVDDPPIAPNIMGCPLVTVSDLPSPTAAGRNLKEWLQEQFNKKPEEQSEDALLHNAAYVGDLDTLRNLLQEDSFKEFHADVDVDHQLGARPPFGAARTLTTLVVCPLYISAAYRHLHCFRLLLSAGAQADYNYNGPVSREALCKGLASCLLDAVLRHGCAPAFVSLLLDHGAEPSLVSWEEPHSEGAAAAGRGMVDPEALQLYLEARRCPRRLAHQCRISIRKVLGKHRLKHIPSLPLPDPIKNFLLHQN